MRKLPVARRWVTLLDTKEPMVAVKVGTFPIDIRLELRRHSAIADHLEDVLRHTELATLEDLLFRTVQNSMGLYTEADIDQVRNEIPDASLPIVSLNEDEALELAWDLIQAVKEMRNKVVNRLTVIS
jgi:hypothetical protein